MAYLIDGNNLLGSFSPESVRDPASRTILIRKLQAFQRHTRTRVILVFDGPPPADLAARPDGKFSVVFPPEGQSADEAIEELIERQQDRRYLIVVSTDREIRAFARAHGASSISADAFGRELKTALRDRREARELEKHDPPASKLEVELWADAFSRKK
jgi:predicted RNA-binding protein with PIN domain